MTSKEIEAKQSNYKEKENNLNELFSKWEGKATCRNKS